MSPHQFKHIIGSKQGGTFGLPKLRRRLSLGRKGLELEVNPRKGYSQELGIFGGAYFNFPIFLLG